METTPFLFAYGKYRKWADKYVYLRWWSGREYGRSLFYFLLKKCLKLDYADPRQCKAENVTSVLSAYTRTMSIRTLGIATISKTVNVFSFNKMYFVEMHVYNVKSANSIQECNIGVYIQRNTIVFCPLTNCSTQINKAGFLATNSLHTYETLQKLIKL
jgi:hypothetical protein